MDVRRAVQRVKDKASTRGGNKKKEAVGFVILSLCVAIMVVIGTVLISPARLTAYLVKRLKRLTKKEDSRSHD